MPQVQSDPSSTKTEQVLEAVEQTQRAVDALGHEIDAFGRVTFAPSLADPAVCFRREMLNSGRLSDPTSPQTVVSVSHVHLSGVSFRSTTPLQPGTVRQLRTDNTGHSLQSKIRIVSSRLRADGTFDIKAEFF